MKPSSSIRLALYIAANATAAASSGLASLDFNDPKQVLDKIDRFVTKYKDVYTKKEVVITAPIKLD